MLTIVLSGVAVAAGETVGVPDGCSVDVGSPDAEGSVDAGFCDDGLDGEGLGDEVLSFAKLDSAFTVVPANTPKNKNRRMTEIMWFLINFYLLFMLILGYTVMVTLLDYFVIRMAQPFFAAQNFKANIT
jgi:hypothetical protein